MIEINDFESSEDGENEMNNNNYNQAFRIFFGCSVKIYLFEMKIEFF